ncbi:MAG: T9SS type A sorting domain-containing protein [Bacteroidia bacterium]
MFVGYKSIWQIGPKGLEPVFTANEGRIFDAMTDSLTLHVSTKVEHPCEFVFTEFSSSDLKTYQLGATSTLPLAHCLHEMPAQPAGKTATDELIRNPLHFYTNSFPQPIGNSYNEIQEYTLGDPYPHPGVDLLGNFQDSVHSVKNGVVKSILTTSAEFHWRVAIANNNTSSRSQGYLYAHVEETTIPYAVGDAVNEGDVVGFLVDWPVTGFTHCHFARISDQGATWSGNWWTLDNPLRFITNITDNTPPAFEYCTAGDLFAFRTIGGTYLTPSALTGSVRVIARFYDIINSTWHIDVDKVRYSLSPLANPSQMLIDTLAHEFNHWNDEYFSGPYSQLVISSLYSRDAILYSQGNYDFRHFYHIVTNSDGNDTITANDENQFLVTTNYPNGDYIFRVTAIDPFGLQTTDSMIITFANPSTSAPTPAENDGLIVYPNPSGDGIFHIRSERPLRYEVCNALGQVVTRGRTNSTDGEVNLSGVAAGVYSLRATDGKTTHSRQLVVEGR